MRTAAEILRWCLIALQTYLVYWMLRTKLWRRLPIWTAWIAAEAVSRVPFQVSGWYAHHFWRPLQPALMFLLGAAAIEAHYQARRRARVVLAYALAVVPIGLILQLPDLIVMRAWLCAGVCIWLGFAGGHFTSRWHARLLAFVSGAAAVTGWMPATPRSWWLMRVGFLGVYSLACVGWIVLFSLPDRRAMSPGLPPAEAGSAR